MADDQDRLDRAVRRVIARASAQISVDPAMARLWLRSVPDGDLVAMRFVADVSNEYSYLRDLEASGAMLKRMAGEDLERHFYFLRSEGSDVYAVEPRATPHMGCDP